MVELELKNVANEGRGNDEAVDVESEKAISNHGISDTLSADEMKNAVNVSSHEDLSPQTVSYSYCILTMNLILACWKFIDFMSLRFANNFLIDFKLWVRFPSNKYTI